MFAVAVANAACLSPPDPSPPEPDIARCEAGIAVPIPASERAEFPKVWKNWVAWLGPASGGREGEQPFLYDLATGITTPLDEPAENTGGLVSNNGTLFWWAIDSAGFQFRWFTPENGEHGQVDPRAENSGAAAIGLDGTNLIYALYSPEQIRSINLRTGEDRLLLVANMSAWHLVGMRLVYVDYRARGMFTVVLPDGTPVPIHPEPGGQIQFDWPLVVFHRNPLGDVGRTFILDVSSNSTVEVRAPDPAVEMEREFPVLSGEWLAFVASKRFVRPQDVVALHLPTGDSFVVGKTNEQDLGLWANRLVYASSDGAGSLILQCLGVLGNGQRT